jgi:hypothetical protein
MPEREIHPPRWTLVQKSYMNANRKVERQNRCTKIHKHLSEPSICYKNIPSRNRYSKHTRSENQLQINQDTSLKISAHILNCVIFNRELCHQTHRARINAFAIANLQQNLFYEIAFNKREARARQRTYNSIHEAPKPFHRSLVLQEGFTKDHTRCTRHFTTSKRQNIRRCINQVNEV